LLKELLPPNAVRLYRSTNHITNWVTCIKSRQPTICDAETGQRTATVCNLANLTYFNRKIIKWDPETESFVDGTGEPSWLTRDYRAPWKVA
jgi:hypothetical protein